MNVTSEEPQADGFWRGGTVYPHPDETLPLRVQIDRDAHRFVVYIMVANRSPGFRHCVRGLSMPRRSPSSRTRGEPGTQCTLISRLNSAHQRPLRRRPEFLILSHPHENRSARHRARRLWADEDVRP
jgi:hypothetical protein